MTEEERWEYINQLDDELLNSGVIISEWSTFLIKDSEIAFCSGAYLSSILSAQSAIESHLRYEFFEGEETKWWGFAKLISELQSRISLESDLLNDLNSIRIFRNKWVHVSNPNNDNDLLVKSEYYEEELLNYSKLAIQTMLRIIYLIQFV